MFDLEEVNMFISYETARLEIQIKFDMQRIFYNAMV